MNGGQILLIKPLIEFAKQFELNKYLIERFHSISKAIIHRQCERLINQLRISNKVGRAKFTQV